MATFNDKGLELKKVIQKESDAHDRLRNLRVAFNAECMAVEVDHAASMSVISDKYSSRMYAIDREIAALAVARVQLRKEILAISMETGEDMVIV